MPNVPYVDYSTYVKTFYKLDLTITDIGSGQYEVTKNAIDGSSTYKYTGSWKKNSKGWWYEDTSGWYPKNQWQKIGGMWYYFDAAGYMEKNAYRDGYRLTSSGAWDGKKAGSWMMDDNGWWHYSLGNGEFLKKTWAKINGKWYYFQDEGIMLRNEFVQGYWLGKTGAMTDFGRCSWHKGKKGWWYGNADGWYAKTTYQIDGSVYNFVLSCGLL